MTAIVKSFEAVSLAASQKEDGGHATTVRASHQAPQTEPLVAWKQPDRGTSRQVRLPVSWALSTKTLIPCPRSNEGSGSPGRALESTLSSYYPTDRTRRSRCTSRSMSKADEIETLAYGGVTSHSVESPTTQNCERHHHHLFNTTVPPATDHRFQSPTTLRPCNNFVRRGPQEGPVRERGDNHPRTEAVLFCRGRSQAAEQTKMAAKAGGVRDIRHDVQWRKPGSEKY